MAKITIPHNFTPRDYQIPLYNCIPDGYKRAVAVWHRRAGKDKTMLNITCREAMKTPAAYYYIFPEYNQGRKILWDGRGKDGMKYMDHFPPEIRKTTRNQEMQIVLKNGSIFQILGSDKIDSNVGTNPRGVVYSEYSLQKPEGWDYFRPILRENGGWAIFNYTPRGRNHGWDIYNTALKNPKWFCELRHIKHTGVLTEEDMDAERAEGMSESLIMQEYYCDFTVSSDDILIPLELAMMAAGRTIHKSEYFHAPKILGVDIARGGDDKCACIKRQGLAAYDLETWRVSKTMPVGESADKISRVMQEWDPDAVFIDANPGFAVVEELRRRGFDKVQAVDFGSSSTNPRYLNKRIQMYQDVLEWIQAGGCIPDDQELVTDLSNTPFSYSRKEQKQLWPKDKIKEELGRSPDCSDALACTFAYPVAAKPRQYAAAMTTRDEENSEYHVLHDA